MSRAPAGHPTLDDLRPFDQGALEDSELDVLAAHLEDCPDCCQRLKGLPDSDPFLKGLRVAHQEHRSASQVTLPAAGPHSTTPFPGPARTPDFTGLFHPPQAAGEIGRLGSYRLLKLLGHGGMGEVFVAEDLRLRRTVALKVMLPEVARRDDARDRFLREARTAAALEHDHVVTIYQVDEDRGMPFIAMPLLKGQSLENRLRAMPPLSLAQVARIGREIALGLAAAHEHGLIHRDVKPSNIW